ncbi:MAG: hypothetical protein AVDCRST_MAG85-4101, partial [uncultured Solirubrobacteraceae bacterium]
GHRDGAALRADRRPRGAVGVGTGLLAAGRGLPRRLRRRRATGVRRRGEAPRRPRRGDQAHVRAARAPRARRRGAVAGRAGGRRPLARLHDRAPGHRRQAAVGRADVPRRRLPGRRQLQRQPVRVVLGREGAV